MGEERNKTIDLLRAGGVLSIIIAHVSSPTWLVNLRCFDVVMLVILSGMSFRISSERSKASYGKYLGKRIKKLLLPTWGILTLIFGVTFLTTHSFEPYGLIKILQSFLLYDGIGYVWFVRVTLMLALVSPLILMISNKCRVKRYGFWAISAVWLGMYTIAVYFYKANILSYWLNLWFYLIVIYLLGYGWFYFVGVHYKALSNIDKKVMAGICVLVFGVTTFVLGIYPSSDKYPPGANYIAYGILAFCILFELCAKLRINICPKCVQFISKNSFSIYLVHIVPVTFLKYSNSLFANIVKKNFVIEYCFVIIITMSVITLWIYMKKRVLRR